MINNWKEFFIDLLFPKECLNCRQPGVYLCQKCLAKIQLNDKFYCVICKKTSPLNYLCRQCQPNHYLKAVWVCADYNNQILHDLIHNLKYRYVEQVSHELTKIMSAYLIKNKIFENFAINKDNTVICSVPLHHKRYLKRGFNQAELIAKNISQIFNIPYQGILIRQKNTQTQVELNKQQRQDNVKDAFAINSKIADISNKKIILIDDVVTTGSTLKECAKVLAANRCDDVYGLVAAQRED